MLLLLHGSGSAQGCPGPNRTSSRSCLSSGPWGDSPKRHSYPARWSRCPICWVTEFTSLLVRSLALPLRKALCPEGPTTQAFRSFPGLPKVGTDKMPLTGIGQPVRQWFGRTPGLSHRIEASLYGLD